MSKNLDAVKERVANLETLIVSVAAKLEEVKGMAETDNALPEVAGKLDELVAQLTAMTS